MKPLLKTIANLAAAVAILPVVVWYRLGAGFVGRDRAFPGCSQAVSLIPGLTGVYLRRAFYRMVLPRCDQDSWIAFGTVFSHATASIGRSAYIGIGCMIGDVCIEEDVLLGSHVSIVNGGGQHGIERLDIPIREQPGTYPRVTIGRDSWIGDRTIVLADIGRHCVIGAGSVVNKPIPDYAIAVGNPARVVRFRNQPEESEAIAADGNGKERRNKCNH